MAASITITLEVRVSTQKKDKVAVTGAQHVLGAWDPAKVIFLKPRKSLQENDVWFTKITVGLSCKTLDYRYLVCRKFNSTGGDDVDETHIIRHWESGIECRHKTIAELGQSNTVDVYGSFEPDKRMFIDQGWLIDETEVQLRFHKNPIRMFRKRDAANSYKVKCSSVNLFHDAYPRQDSYAGQNLGYTAEELFDRVIHASNPLIRVSALGRYWNKEQSVYGMSMSSDDYMFYKLRTYELDSHGIKVDFYSDVSDQTTAPTLLGYTNILPLHLDSGSGSLVLAVTGSHGLPIGQVTVSYLVCKPMLNLKYDLEKSFTQYWNRCRPTLEIGHRGLGDTHHSDFNTKSQLEDDIKHENTLSSLITAGQSGADFVEFDVMVSKDKVPVIWHDFKVSILLRKRIKGKHRVYHIPVHELLLSQIQELRVDFAKENADIDHTDMHESVDQLTSRNNLSPFPTLKEALDAVDEKIGFYVEVKYPQRVYGTKQLEEGLESYFERNTVLDPILDVLYRHGRNRRIVLASFDADICMMARIKQNCYPVIMLIEDLGSKQPFYHDVRTQSIRSAISFARSEKLLGLSVNAGALLRRERSLLEEILNENLVCFVWGPEANRPEVREELKGRGVHAICHDEIGSSEYQSVLRAGDEEKLTILAEEYQKYSAPVSPDPNGSDSSSSEGLLTKEQLTGLLLATGFSNPSPLSSSSNLVGSSLPVTGKLEKNGISESTIIVNGHQDTPSNGNDLHQTCSRVTLNDYTNDFY
ncbi:glycerophosphocholine phosphodiesterase GPCPD1-like [Watersipora subatra]|uniref:glycerophosphocholine phosphodiesterase GPCPD1-like n=1 Tax=Watersipora subatra TaxID=2589382 RepID=UPI00355C0995